MKKGKYIDYNILLACLSHRPKVNQNKYAQITAADKKVILLQQIKHQPQVA